MKLPSHILAQRTQTMGASAIREILKVISQPGMVSLAGGNPAPESFPLDLMRALTDAVLEKYGAGALQYDATEGFGPLRQARLTTFWWPPVPKGFWTVWEWP